MKTQFRQVVVVPVVVVGIAACSVTDSANKRPEAMAEQKVEISIQTLDQLVATSDVIVVGRAEQVVKGRIDGSPNHWRTLRNVMIAPEDVLKGKLPPGTLSFEEGGWIDGKIGYVVEDQPWTEVGDRVLVFLKQSSMPDFSNSTEASAVQEPEMVDSYTFVGEAGLINLDRPTASSEYTLDLLGQKSSGVAEEELSSLIRRSLARVESEKISPVTAAPPVDFGLLVRAVDLGGTDKVRVSVEIRENGVCVVILEKEAIPEPACIEASAIEESREQDLFFSVAQLDATVLLRKGDLKSGGVVTPDGSKVAVSKVENIPEFGVSVGFASL
jgi:hypothetical protein